MNNTKSSLTKNTAVQLLHSKHFYITYIKYYMLYIFLEAVSRHFKIYPDMPIYTYGQRPVTLYTYNSRLVLMPLKQELYKVQSVYSDVVLTVHVTYALHPQG
jgi:hypothetical protein